MDDKAFDARALVRETLSELSKLGRPFGDAEMADIFYRKGYAAGRAANGCQSYEEGRTVTQERDDAHSALARTCIEYEKVIADLRAKLAAPAPAQLNEEQVRKLADLRDEMWRASDNRFAANYAIQTPGKFAGYVIPADKAQQWAERLNALLRSQPAGAKAPK